jgi:hypothetical protein
MGRTHINPVTINRRDLLTFKSCCPAKKIAETPRSPAICRA